MKVKDIVTSRRRRKTTQKMKGERVAKDGKEDSRRRPAKKPLKENLDRTFTITFRKVFQRTHFSKVFSESTVACANVLVDVSWMIFERFFTGSESSKEHLNDMFVKYNTAAVVFAKKKNLRRNI